MYSKYSSPVKFLTRVAVVIFVFGFFLFSNVPTALAAWGNWGNNNLDKKVETLPNIEKKAAKATKTSPYELNKYSSNINQGLNEIQGTSDMDKMKRPDSTLPIVKDMEKNLKNSQENASNAINSTLDDAGNSLDTNLEKASNAISDLAEKAGNTTESIKDQVGKTLNGVQDKMKN